MKLWVHLFAGLILWLFLLVMQYILVTDTALGQFNARVKLYTLTLIRPSQSSAFQNAMTNWIAAPCVSMTNLSADPTGTCRQARQGLYTTILQAMGCDQYRSQSCAYMVKMLSGIITNVTNSTTNATYALGKDLTNAKADYMTMFNNAPILFHNPYRAVQNVGFQLVIPVHYTLAGYAVFFNLLLAVIDHFYPSLQRLQFSVVHVIMDVIFLILSFGGSFPVTGAAPILGMILGPTLFTWVWYEAYLPKTHRPWMQPVQFTVGFVALYLLAVVENGVSNYYVVLMEGFKALAVAQMYMSVSWYWVGHWEKTPEATEVWFKRHSKQTHHRDAQAPATPRELKKGAVDEMYHGRDATYALLMSVVFILLVPIQLLLAPYDYNYAAVLLLLSPLILAILAVFGTSWVQKLNLGDLELIHAKMVDWEKYMNYLASNFSESKLFLSFFTLLLLMCLTLNYFAEYLTSYYAKNTQWPTGSVQYDPTVAYLVSPGLT